MVVAGMMNDKAVESSLKPLLLKTSLFVAVTPQNPRAMQAEVLAQIAKKYCGNVINCNDANEAISMAKAELTEKDALFVVGSLYLAGEVREKLIKEFTNID